MHRCPAPDCRNQVPDNQLACRMHWFTLPLPIRKKVWHAYRVYGPGSLDHLEAITEATDWLEENHKVQAAKRGNPRGAT